ncbi:hypothetical protein GIY23_19785 [Allosaccharopolyspora coralli]|uniref:VCBS repeat-containing protein n=1 Tax=Allosaccharopolyspora coralli TaxID=2665642 RepID=A0A5Q3QAN7_9PSEU|nr:hypothetical protein [Allosaccharopolyspora coralli]QGK71453.1 hypothetical protein GIY23_19785 [Allosaccharopolyspora coralli]
MLGKAGKLVAVGFAGTLLITPGIAAAQGDEFEEHTVKADVDGDGRADGVTLREVSEDTHALIFGLAGEQIDTTYPGNASFPLQKPRPTDVNLDGSHEVIVTEYVGANTLTFNVRDYDPASGIRSVSTEDGAPLKLFEGGGVSGNSGYSCLDDHTGTRELVSVTAHVTSTPDDTPLFSGERVSYLVDNGVATETHRAEFNDVPREDPVMETNPESCGVSVS